MQGQTQEQLVTAVYVRLEPWFTDWANARLDWVHHEHCNESQVSASADATDLQQQDRQAQQRAPQMMQLLNTQPQPAAPTPSTLIQYASNYEQHRLTATQAPLLAQHLLQAQDHPSLTDNTKRCEDHCIHEDTLCVDQLWLLYNFNCAIEHCVAVVTATTHVLIDQVNGNKEVTSWHLRCNPELVL